MNSIKTKTPKSFKEPNPLLHAFRRSFSNIRTSILGSCCCSIFVQNNKRRNPTDPKITHSFRISIFVISIRSPRHSGKVFIVGLFITISAHKGDLKKWSILVFNSRGFFFCFSGLFFCVIRFCLLRLLCLFWFLRLILVIALKTKIVATSFSAME